MLLLLIDIFMCLGSSASSETISTSHIPGLFMDCSLQLLLRVDGNVVCVKCHITIYWLQPTMTTDLLPAKVSENFDPCSELSANQRQCCFRQPSAVTSLKKKLKMSSSWRIHETDCTCMVSSSIVCNQICAQQL
jgi:hypothetical protein